VRAERSLVLDAGLAATALAAGVVLVETQIAAGSLSPGAIHAFLLTDTPGLARVGLMVLLALAVAGAVMAPCYGGVVAALALGELALSGHADSATPRALAVLVDWIHLLAGALWLGGIAVIAWIWVGRLRGAGPELRRAVMDYAIDYPNIRDPSNDVARTYGVTGVPETFFISSGGQIVGHIIGASSTAQLTAGINAALAGHVQHARRGSEQRPLQ
jgi:hypothetical protein